MYFNLVTNKIKNSVIDGDSIVQFQHCNDRYIILIKILHLSV